VVADSSELRGVVAQQINVIDVQEQNSDVRIFSEIVEVIVSVRVGEVEGLDSYINLGIPSLGSLAKAVEGLPKFAD
jgi:hypothetical protein